MKNRLINIFSLFVFATLVTSTTEAYAQKKPKPNILSALFSSQIDTTRAPSILILPALAFSPETGVEFGGVGNYTFFQNRKDPRIRSSQIGLIATMTSKKQSNIKLFTNVWTTDNDKHYMADINYKNYPFNFYGIGDQTKSTDKILLHQKLFRVNIEAEKNILKNYYTGLNLKFEDFYFNTDELNFDSNSYYGATGGRYLALGLSQLYDSRNSSTNTSKGLYARLKYAYAPNLWKGSNFHGHLASLDLRAFLPLNKKFTLGFNSIFNTVLSTKTPFYIMSKLGNDEMMRGYYSGRFRDKNLLTFQSELRYRIHPRFSLAAFSAAGTVYHKNIDLSHLKFSYGSGIRYFFNLEHETSIRIDYAIGEKMPGEKRQTGFYLALGQAF